MSGLDAARDGAVPAPLPTLACTRCDRAYLSAQLCRDTARVQVLCFVLGRAVHAARASTRRGAARRVQTAAIASARLVQCVQTGSSSRLRVGARLAPVTRCVEVGCVHAGLRYRSRCSVADAVVLTRVRRLVLCVTILCLQTTRSTTAPQLPAQTELRVLTATTSSHARARPATPAGCAQIRVAQRGRVSTMAHALCQARPQLVAAPTVSKGFTVT